MKINRLIFTALLLFTNLDASEAWKPPIGIPAPDWGPIIGNPIDAPAPKPPAVWKSNIPNVYYVESGGTNPNEGFPGNPRNAIPLILPAGSVVFVNGIYTQIHDPYYIRHAGTAEKPCWILSYDPENPAVCTKPWVFTSNETYPCSYLIIDNIDWDWSASGGSLELGGGVDHICFRNGSTKGKGVSNPGDPEYTNDTPAYNASAFVVQSSGSLIDDPSEHLVIANMDISKGGNWMYESGDPDAHGISVGFPVKDMWFVDNSISYFSGCAIQVGAGSIDSTPDTRANQRMYMGRNTAHHIAQSAFWTKRSIDCIMSQNIAHTIRRTCPSSPNSGGFGAQYGPKNLWIIYNTVYNCQNGIAIASGADGLATDTDVYIVGNLIYNIHDEVLPIENWRENSHSGGGTAILLRGGLDHYVINNTIDDYDAGILSPIIGHNRYIEGNILSNRNARVSGVDINLPGDEGGKNSIKNNIIQHVSGECYVASGDRVFRSVSALNTAKGPGNISNPPGYVNAALGNYMLLPSSGAVDSLSPSANAAYRLFQTMYGRSIDFDRRGGPRPFNGIWDIGAYEYRPDGFVTPSPARPSGVKGGIAD